MPQAEFMIGDALLSVYWPISDGTHIYALKAVTVNFPQEVSIYEVVGEGR